MATVLATFSVLRNHIKLKVNRENPAIDNIVFKLHYRATFLALVASSLLVSSRQFIGEHIKCISDTAVSTRVLETYCFFTSTFTVVKHLNLTAVEEGEIPHPGVGPWGKRDEIVHHAYYQWVPFVLFFQAILFYLPHHIWKAWEGGRLKVLVSGLRLSYLMLEENTVRTDTGTVIPSKSDRDDEIRQIRIAFLNRLHLNRPWAYYLVLCEMLNFLNILLQIYVTNWFLGGIFFDFGKSVTNYDPNEVDPFDRVFPKVTKCTFHKYGPTGTMQRHDALCVMALNIVNEKIYTFLYFWFIIVFIVTVLGLLWRILTMTLHSRSNYFNKMVYSLACPGKYNPWDFLKVTHENYFGDWLFLYYIAKNVDNYVFRDLLQQLVEEMESKKWVKNSHNNNYPDIEAELLKKE